MKRAVLTLLLLLSFSFAISVEEIKNFKIDPQKIRVTPIDIIEKYDEEISKILEKAKDDKELDKLLEELDKKFDPITQKVTKECIKDKKFLTLTQLHIKLYSILYKGATADKYDIAKVNSDTFITLFMPPNIKKLIQEQEADVLIEELLKYYNKITSTPDWEKRLKVILKEPPEDKEEPLYKRVQKSGFKPSSNICYNTLIDYSSNPDEEKGVFFYTSEVTLDSFLYSFWARRYQNNTMKTAKAILEELKK